MGVLLRFALFAALAAVAHATCAIAVWTQESIILGSDSRETYLSPYRGPTTSSECKLRQIGPYYVIVSGVMQHQQSGFDVFDILGDSVMRTRSVTEAAEAASVEIARRYADVLRQSRLDSSGKYQSELEINAPVFAIAGFSKGRPYLAHYEYNLVGGVWKWSKWVYGTSRADRSMEYVYLCDPAGIAMFKRQHPRWRTEDPRNVVRGMIAAAARVDTLEVGGPTALLVIDASGSRWESTGICARNYKRAPANVNKPVMLPSLTLRVPSGPRPPVRNPARQQGEGEESFRVFHTDSLLVS